RLFAALADVPMPVLEVKLDRVRRFALSSRADRLAATWEMVCYLRSIPNAERVRWCADLERAVPVPEAAVNGRILTWEQARTMLKGGVSFGAHTMTHPAVSQLSASELEEELTQSKALIENRLDIRVEDFAYPFGKAGDCSLEAEHLLSALKY